ncbi:MAG: hypothetical protein IE909_09695 [Campylobacterales bacterium]|nr:hypothetical protein [Campylobacterales bacterium]
MRLRYIRALERFHSGLISYLSGTPDLKMESFVRKVYNSFKLLKRVDEIVLYKGDLQDLQKLVQKIIFYKDSDKEISEIKEDILYGSNQLEKSKNTRRYKKDKHVGDKYQDWEWPSLK